MRLMYRITLNPNQCGGRPCIRGMRIRAKDVLDMLAAGETSETILVDYPDLEADDIRACFEYAARQMDHAVHCSPRPVLPLSLLPISSCVPSVSTSAPPSCSPSD